MLCFHQRSLCIYILLHTHHLETYLWAMQVMSDVCQAINNNNNNNNNCCFHLFRPWDSLRSHSTRLSLPIPPFRSSDLSSSRRPLTHRLSSWSTWVHSCRVFVPVSLAVCDLIRKLLSGKLIHSAVCLTTGPSSLPNRVLHRVRSSASSLSF